MGIVSALLLSISANLDNLFLGMTFGISGRRITAGANLLIGFLSAVATFACSSLATLLTGFGRVPDLIGGALIIVLGVRAMLEPEPAPPDKTGADTGQLPFRDTLMLGAALAVNCFGLSFGAGLSGIPPLSAAIAVGAASVLTVGLGNSLGRHAGLLVSGRGLNRVSGLLMLALGALQIVL